MITVISPTTVPFTNSGNNLPIASIHLLMGVTYTLDGTIFNTLFATGAAGQAFFGLSFSGTVTSSAVDGAGQDGYGSSQDTGTKTYDFAPMWSPISNSAPGMSQARLSGTITPATDGDLVLYGQDFVVLNGDTVTVSGTLVAQ